jgi:hypothetical protein
MPLFDQISIWKPLLSLSAARMLQWNLPVLTAYLKSNMQIDNAGAKFLC